MSPIISLISMLIMIVIMIGVPVSIFALCVWIWKKLML